MKRLKRRLITMTWTDYKPFQNGANNTLWELGRMIADQWLVWNPTTTPEDELIQYEGLPVLVKWLFENTDIDMTQTVWQEFIKQFVSVYLNRETSFMNSQIFRNKLMNEVVQYKEFIENAAKQVYENMVAAGYVMTETGTENKHLTQNDENTNNVTNNTVVAGTGTVSNNDNTNTTSTSNNTGTVSNTGEQNTQTTGTNTGTVSDSGTGKTTTTGSSTNDVSENTGTDLTTTTNDYDRNLMSNTPQSIVSSSTTGNPDSINWTYATELRDDIKKGSKTDSGETTHTVEGSTSETGLSETVNSNTQTLDTANTGSSLSNVTDTQTLDTQLETVGSVTNIGTTNTTVDNSTDTTTAANFTGTKTATGEDTYSITRDGAVPILANKEKYDFFISNLKTPLNTVISNLDKLFISMYIEEERCGYLDWKAYSSLTKYIM